MEGQLTHPQALFPICITAGTYFGNFRTSEKMVLDGSCDRGNWSKRPGKPNSMAANQTNIVEISDVRQYSDLQIVK